MFNAGACNTDGVAFLKGVLTNRMGRYLPRNDHHRNRIHVGRYQAGHCVGYSRTGGHECNAHLIGTSRIRIRCMNRRLLMANQYMLEFILLEDGVVNVQNCAAGIAEHMFNTLFG